MPDDPTDGSGPDRSRIDITDKQELAYWAKELDTSATMLILAVREVGPLIDSVKKYLRLPPGGIGIN
jgi:hypothetical protein